MRSPSTAACLARVGAVAALVGAPLLLISTLLHPLGADPNDAIAAFAEYARSAGWVWIHLGQFVGLILLSLALVALGDTFEPGRAAAWARIGIAGAGASIAVAAAVQAVDGVALKFMVDRWAAASPEARGPVFEAVFAVRQIEIGLGSLLSIVSGLTLATFGYALIVSAQFPTWFGGVGLLDGLAMAAAGAAQAHVGFAEPGMTMSMMASSVLVIWFFVAGILMWPLVPSNKDEF